MGWHRSIIGFLVGLILHASTLATIPLIWCVSAHGHNAIELCAGPTCHQGPLPAAASAQASAGTEVGPPVAAPVVIAVPAPLAIEQTSIVRSHRCVPGKLFFAIYGSTSVKVYRSADLTCRTIASGSRACVDNDAMNGCTTVPRRPCTLSPSKALSTRAS